MILPGATLGVVGGGQLGRFFLIEARKYGYRTAVYTDEKPGSPAGQIADIECNGPYLPGPALKRFLAEVDAVTFEFENVPASFGELILNAGIHTAPHPSCLHTCQNREREKQFLKREGIPCAPFRIVSNADELGQAIQELGLPSILKTADFGYDGKGQIKFSSHPDNLEVFWDSFHSKRAVLEGFVPFVRELSIVAARGADGDFQSFPACDNTHRNHILHLTLMPAQVPDQILLEAKSLAQRIAEALGYVGTFCVEFFLLEDNTLLVNEIAPRPHNSGHATLDACLVSQFGQQMRALTGLPLADPQPATPVAMLNLLGDLWPAPTQPPDWTLALAHPEARLHLYGKTEARKGRKMGHLNVLSVSTSQAEATAQAIFNALENSLSSAGDQPA